MLGMTLTTFSKLLKDNLTQFELSFNNICISAYQTIFISDNFNVKLSVANGSIKAKVFNILLDHLQLWFLKNHLVKIACWKSSINQENICLIKIISCLSISRKEIIFIIRKQDNLLSINCIYFLPLSLI